MMAESLGMVFEEKISIPWIVMNCVWFCKSVLMWRFRDFQGLYVRPVAQECFV